jgi:hypothetical protein
MNIIRTMVAVEILVVPIIVMLFLQSARGRDRSMPLAVSHREDVLRAVAGLIARDDVPSGDEIGHVRDIITTVEPVEAIATLRSLVTELAGTDRDLIRAAVAGSKSVRFAAQNALIRLGTRAATALSRHIKQSQGDEAV